MAGWWKKTLVYLGLVEEEDELEPLPNVTEPPRLESVRPIQPDTPTTVRPVPSVVTPAPTITATPMVTPRVSVHVVEPMTFNDVQEVGDKLKVDQPVIMNLQRADPELKHRLLDFASGVTYALSGQIKKVASHVFLLTPANVTVPETETERIINERGFFNQF